MQKRYACDNNKATRIVTEHLFRVVYGIISGPLNEDLYKMRLEKVMLEGRNNMEKAIILNAGKGRRLRPLTENVPKCLIEIGNKTILEHQLSNLMECGIKELVLVIGYHSNKILEKLKQSSFDLKIKCVRNPIYYKTNTVYSLWLARNEMDTDFVYLNGDIFFHVNVLRRLIDSKYDTCLAIDTKRMVGKEEVKVRTIDGVIREIGKEMEASLADGEFIGIAKFSKEINVLFRKGLDEIVKEGEVNAFFELAVQRMLNNYTIYAVDVSNLPCIEIDTHDDLEEAKNMYRKIRGKC